MDKYCYYGRRAHGGIGRKAVHGQWFKVVTNSNTFTMFGESLKDIIKGLVYGLFDNKQENTTLLLCGVKSINGEKVTHAQVVDALEELEDYKDAYGREWEKELLQLKALEIFQV